MTTKPARPASRPPRIPVPAASVPAVPAQAEMVEPVPLWEHGRSERQIDAARARETGYLVVDLGESWTPYLFTDGTASDGTWLPNAYRPTYLALARGEFPDGPQGERARRDKYLELYGIAPTLSVLRARLVETASLECVHGLDLTALQRFTGVVSYTNNQDAKREAARFASAKAHTLALMRAQNVASADALDTRRLSSDDAGQLEHYLKQLPRFAALDALQKRLRCERILVGRGRYIPGVMDWATHESLAEFERRHRIFSQGYLARESRAALTQPPLELEQAAVLRTLTERAIHAAGVLEDGSAQGASYRGHDGAEHPVPNLAGQLRAALVEAFGLQTPESTLDFLQGLGELPADEHRYVAIKMVPLPDYYDNEMSLTLDYDRGDVWYDFPYDDHGKPIAQPVKQRPQVTVSTLYEGQKIPLARYGTTIGGWRSELVDGTLMWKYKDSPVGPRAWDEVVAAPVWLPPSGTPPQDLLTPNPQRALANEPEYVVNYHEVGPSYASAYGLVAAYHKTYLQKADGTIRLGTDEGVRTHGSVDYMSIMRRHSHGCHRLHNHVALRLMSFVLAHRPHERLGPRMVGLRREFAYQGKTYTLDIPRTGYTFRLKTPLLVTVGEGNILGAVKAPITFPIPQYDTERQAYVLADGTKVQVRGNQLVPATSPPPALAPSSASSALHIHGPAAVARAPARSLTGTGRASGTRAVASVRSASVR